MKLQLLQQKGYLVLTFKLETKRGEMTCSISGRARTGACLISSPAHFPLP